MSILLNIFRDEWTRLDEQTKDAQRILIKSVENFYKKINYFQELYLLIHDLNNQHHDSKEIVKIKTPNHNYFLRKKKFILKRIKNIRKLIKVEFGGVNDEEHKLKILCNSIIEKHFLNHEDTLNMIHFWENCLKEQNRIINIILEDEFEVIIANKKEFQNTYSKGAYVTEEYQQRRIQSWDKFMHHLFLLQKVLNKEATILIGSVGDVAEWHVNLNYIIQNLKFNKAFENLLSFTSKMKRLANEKHITLFHGEEGTGIIRYITEQRYPSGFFVCTDLQSARIIKTQVHNVRPSQLKMFEITLPIETFHKLFDMDPRPGNGRRDVDEAYEKAYYMKASNYPEFNTLLQNRIINIKKK